MISGLKDKPITLVINETTINQFINDCENIYQTSLTNDSYCGIDFEFNMNWKTKERYISLMQIILIPNANTYHNTDVPKPIYILDPLKFDKTRMKKLIKYIFCSKVIKIFHGSDSLDYPHVYEHILKKNKKKFIKFINYSIDTRFMCEISKRIMTRLNLLNIDNKKCSIYNALFDHGILDKKTFDDLTHMSSKINYNKDWKINNLTKEQISYAMYDVAYLYDLVETIVKSVEISPQVMGNIKDDLVSVINRMYRFHMINRLKISQISNRCKSLIDRKNISKEKFINIDQKIMDNYMMTIIYKQPLSNSNISSTGTIAHELTINIEDILSIDTLRKSLLYCLRVFEINDSDTQIASLYFKNSKPFNKLKGHHTIWDLINIIKIKKEHQKHITCD